MRSGSAAASASSSRAYSDDPPWIDAVTRRWMSRDEAALRSWTLWVMTGLPMTSGGKSHSWVTPTSSSPRPIAHTISVADGRRETMRIARPWRARLPGPVGPALESGRLQPVDRGAGGRLVGAPGRIDGCVVGPFGRQRLLGEDRVDRALGLTCAAIDALVRIDVQLAIGPLVE